MSTDTPSQPAAIYVWLVPSEQMLEQPGSWRIRKWDTAPFPEANYTLAASSETVAGGYPLTQASLSATGTPDVFDRAVLALRGRTEPLSAIAPSRETEYKRLLGEWLKKAEAHRGPMNEFKGGYQPFLERATRDFLAACERTEPEWP